MSNETRLWQCFSCGKVYKIPVHDPDPDLCWRCSPLPDPEKFLADSTPSPSNSVELTGDLPPAPPVSKETEIMGGIFTILLICGTVYWFFSTGKKPATAITPARVAAPYVTPEFDDTTARVMVRENVKLRLKNPRGAKFPWGMDFMKVGNGVWRTTSYVDATNSFNAVIRTHFVAEVNQSGTVTSLRLLE